MLEYLQKCRYRWKAPHIPCKSPDPWNKPVCNARHKCNCASKSHKKFQHFENPYDPRITKRISASRIDSEDAMSFSTWMRQTATNVAQSILWRVQTTLPVVMAPVGRGGFQLPSRRLGEATGRTAGRILIHPTNPSSFLSKPIGFFLPDASISSSAD